VNSGKGMACIYLKEHFRPTAVITGTKIRGLQAVATDLIGDHSHYKSHYGLPASPRTGLFTGLLRFFEKLKNPENA
jgi:hypothetical protein